MKKMGKQGEKDEEEYIFSEGIDYSETGKKSIWGLGDKDTLDILRKADIRGRWLNLAAGDGRYNLYLLEKADLVVASDIDKGAITKLRDTTPERYRNRLDTTAFDLTKEFPFGEGSFDGVFCASTLHYFQKDVLRHIFSETDRVTKKGARIIVEFATDIKRVFADGSLYIREPEPLYSYLDAVSFLRELLKNYKVEIIESEVPPEEIRTKRHVYTLSCRLIILAAKKD